MTVAPGDMRDLEARIDREVEWFSTRLAELAADGRSLCASSSFQSHSIPLLHMLSGSGRRIPIFFLDTGFHFPETLAYRDRIADLLDLDLRVVDPDVPKIAQIHRSGSLLFAVDPDECCRLNKVDPMDRVLRRFDVWITGVRREQTENRATMAREAQRSDGILRFNPLLDWSLEMIDGYRERYGLPLHPLAGTSTTSIGCAPCTRLDTSDGRDGRWTGMVKTECGLHLDPA